MMLPIAHATAAATTSRNPTSVTLAPAASTFIRDSRSPRNATPSAIVKNTCSWITSDESPAGMPSFMPRKSSPNWQTPIAKPYATRSRDGIAGRATKNATGTDASRNRSAASTNGGKSASAHLIGTNAKPHSATTSRIQARSRADRARLNAALRCHSEILWFMSSTNEPLGIECSSIAIDRERHTQQFAGEDHRGFGGRQAARAIAFVERMPYFGLAGGARGVEQQATQLRRPALGQTSPPDQFAGVFGARIEADKGDRGVGVAQRHAGKGVGERHADQWADAEHAFNALLGFGLSAGELAQAAVEFGNQAIEPLENRAQIAGAVSHAAQAQRKPRASIDHGSTPAQQLIDLALRRGGGRVGMQVAAFVGEVARDQPRVDAIGLAAHADATGIVAQVVGIDHVHDHAGAMRQVGEQLVIAPGGFHRNAAARGQRGQPSADRRAVVAQSRCSHQRICLGDLQRVLGNVNSKIQRAWHGGVSVVRYALPGWTPTDVRLYPNRRSADRSRWPLDSSSTLVAGRENSRKVRP